MNTYTVVIGNSDDRLTQQQWAEYCGNIADLCERAGQVHFMGYSPGGAPWQNMAVVVEVAPTGKDDFITQLACIRKAYHQESVAIVLGATSFI